MYDKDRKSVVPCEHCGQWGVVYTVCKKCGAPIRRVQCEHCGAPMPDKVVHISGPYFSSEAMSPYWMDGGVSLRASGQITSWWKD